MSEALKRLRDEEMRKKQQKKKGYKIRRPYVTKEDLEDARRSGLIVRLVGIRKDYTVYSIDGYRVMLKK